MSGIVNPLVPLTELSDKQLIDMRDYYNKLLEPAFMVDSGKYDAIAAVVKAVEKEIHRREQEGPPWVAEEEKQDGYEG